MTMIDTLSESRRAAAVQQSLLGLAQQALGFVRGLLLMPMYLHYIPVRIYGLWLGTGGILALLDLWDMGLGTLTTQRIAACHGRRDMLGIATYFIASRVVFTVLAILAGTSVAVIASFLPRLIPGGGIEEEPLFLPCFLLAGMATVFRIFTEGMRASFEAIQRPLVAQTPILISRLLGILVIVLGLMAGLGLLAIAVGALVEAAIPYFVLVGIAPRYFGTSRTGAVHALRDMVRLSPFTILPRLLHTALRRLEPYVVTVIVAPEFTVGYVAIQRIGDLIHSALCQFSGASFAPLASIFSQRGIQGTARAVSDVLRGGIAAASIAFALYLCCGGAFIRLWLGPDHFPGQWLSFWMTAAFLAMTARVYLAHILTATGHIAMTSLLLAVETVVRMLVIGMLLGTLSYYAPAVATAVTCSGLALVMVLRLQQRGLQFLLAPQIMAVYALAIGGAGVVGGYLANSIVTWMPFWGFSALCTLVLLLSLLIDPPLQTLLRRATQHVFLRIPKHSFPLHS